MLKLTSTKSITPDGIIAIRPATPRRVQALVDKGLTTQAVAATYTAEVIKVDNSGGWSDRPIAELIRDAGSNGVRLTQLPSGEAIAFATVTSVKAAPARPDLEDQYGAYVRFEGRQYDVGFKASADDINKAADAARLNRTAAATAPQPDGQAARARAAQRPARGEQPAAKTHG